MKKIFVIFIIIFSFSCSDGKQNNNPEITAEEIKEHITYLASDELEGRFSGSEGLKEAAEYITDEFESYGLQPLFGNNYIQEFKITTGYKLTDNNSLILIINDDKITAESEKDFTVLSFSGDGKAEGEIVFAGYGISAPILKYDDYENIDVKGKIILVMRHNPEYDNPHSPFNEYSTFRYKASTARNKGATGIIFVNGYLPEDSTDKLIELKHDRGGKINDFPVIHVKRHFVDQMFQAHDLSFKDYQKEISDLKRPASFLFKKISASVQTEVEEVKEETWNVAGYLEGSDPSLKNQYIVVGAHFDHLGMGEMNSLYRGESAIHNGADDNASGTTGVLELAEKFSSEKSKIKRSIIFICFSGEELGLLGSNYFVNNSPVPTEDMAAMINLDMIGRMSSNKLIIYGTGTAPNWKELIDKNNSSDFNITYNDDGYGPSDHSSFYSKNIPVLFFFTGTHADYHRPTDDAELINIEDEKKILELVYKIVSDVNSEKEKPEYISISRRETGTTTGWKVYVGTIPDYSTEDKFKITGVSEDSPAEKAGLQGGDIILKFGGKDVSNIYDYMYALKDYAPGDVVDVVVLRNEKEFNLKVKLEAR